MVILNAKANSTLFGHFMLNLCDDSPAMNVLATWIFRLRENQPNGRTNSYFLNIKF